jgi:hypothetical protein
VPSDVHPGLATNAHLLVEDVDPNMIAGAQGIRGTEHEDEGVHPGDVDSCIQMKPNVEEYRSITTTNVVMTISSVSQETAAPKRSEILSISATPAAG